MYMCVYMYMMRGKAFVETLESEHISLPLSLPLSLMEIMQNLKNPGCITIAEMNRDI